MNPILFSIGPFHIYWYSFILLIAFSFGFFLLLKQAEKEGINRSIIYDYACYLIPISLVGARLYYVLFEINHYISDPLAILRVWEGGLAIHGGIIAGAVFTYFYTKKKNIPFLKLTDILVISLIIGQILGRWGNFFNGEAYGPETTYAFLHSLHLPEFIIKGMFIEGVYYQPTFLYESLWNLLGLLLLLIVKKKCHVKGTISALYVIHYGIGRFFIESLRQDSLMLGPIRVAQLISIFMIIIGIGMLFYTRKEQKNESKI
jgi:phosphatidylglycerol:prolipoprotein diacylglycerol transferase